MMNKWFYVTVIYRMYKGHASKNFVGKDIRQYSSSNKSAVYENMIGVEATTTSCVVAAVLREAMENRANELIPAQRVTKVDSILLEFQAFAKECVVLRRRPMSDTTRHSPGEVALGHNQVLAAISPKLSDAPTMAYLVLSTKAG